MAEPARKPIQYPNNSEGYDKGPKIGFNAWNGTLKSAKEEVVLKLFHVDASLDKERMKQALALLTIYSQSSPGLLRAYSFFFSQDVLWVVVDPRAWQEGNVKDLMSISSPEGLEESIIRSICAQLLAPLDFLHKNGRIFRDLKAKNVMILPSGEVQLQIFTLPSILQDKAPTYKEALYWLAPEILPSQENKVVGPAIDVWALGIMMLEMALGQAPLQALDLPPPQILGSIAEGPAPTLTPEQRSKFSKAFVDVIDMCLNKNPTKRATIAELQQHSWFKNAMKPDHIVENFLAKLPSFKNRLKVFLAGTSVSHHGGHSHSEPRKGKLAPPKPKKEKPTSNSKQPSPSDDEKIEQVPLEENDSDDDINTNVFDIDDGDFNDDYESDDESAGSYTDEPIPVNSPHHPGYSAQIPIPRPANPTSPPQANRGQPTSLTTSIIPGSTPVGSVPGAPVGGSTTPVGITSPIAASSVPYGSIPPLSLGASAGQPTHPSGAPAGSPSMNPAAPGANPPGAAGAAGPTATAGGEVRGRFKITQAGINPTGATGAPPVPNSAPTSGPSPTPVPQNPVVPEQQPLNHISHGAAVPSHLATLPGVSIQTTTNTPFGPATITAPLKVPAPGASPFDNPPDGPGAAYQVQQPSHVQQLPQWNVPLDSYLGETDREFVIYVRTIPGTTIRTHIEGRVLVLTGATPGLPPALLRGVTLQDRVTNKFERRIRFATEIDPNEPVVEMYREHQLMVVRIKKFPQMVDLGIETF